MREELKVLKNLQSVLKEKYSTMKIDEYCIVDSDCIPIFSLESEDVDLQELEMHCVYNDLDYMEDFIDLVKENGWVLSGDETIVKKGCSPVNLRDVYFADGCIIGYMFSNGMYLDLNTGMEVKDIQRAILIKEFDGKYESISVDKDILFLDSDVIENILSISYSSGLLEDSFYCCEVNPEIREAIKGKLSLNKEFPKIEDNYCKIEIPDSVLNVITDFLMDYYETCIIKFTRQGTVYFGDDGVLEECYEEDLYSVSKEDIFKGNLKDVDYVYVLVKNGEIHGDCWLYNNHVILG